MPRKPTADEYIDELEDEVNRLRYELDDARHRIQQLEDADPPRHVWDLP